MFSVPCGAKQVIAHTVTLEKKKLPAADGGYAPTPKNRFKEWASLQHLMLPHVLPGLLFQNQSGFPPRRGVRQLPGDAEAGVSHCGSERLPCK